MSSVLLESGSVHLRRPPQLPACEPTGMVQLLYVSSARQSFDKAALMRLLACSRRNNAELGVTGLLLFKGGNFLQVLEGAEASVRSLYRRIEADPRHGDLVVMIEERVVQRTFCEWAMGFRDLADPGLRGQEGFSDLMNDRRRHLDAAGCETGCLELIEFFRSGR